MEEVAKDTRENSSNWWMDHHYGFGIGVRNLLRKGGFECGPIDLDRVWVELVEKAVKKKFGNAELTK